MNETPIEAVSEWPRRVELPGPVWREREAAHRARVAPRALDWLRRRSRGESHPVWDFLFTYYRFPVGRLMTWVPGVIEVESAPSVADGTDRPETVAWEVPALPERVRDLARWVARLCEAMLVRPARYHCYGLHEWAMVYGQTPEELRHRGWRLRLEPEAVARAVESQSLVCTHYDAFRFFTPAARPRNQGSPDREGRVEWEQGGCLHANMDLYKWAHKLWPWVGSDLVGEAFAVAVQGRALDMQASPYDLQALGFEPVCITTESGRERFRQEQQRLARTAEPIRRRLLEAARRLGHGR